jgi:hypothetical protein
MTSASARPTGSSNPNPPHRAQACTGRFMLTLCRLAAPVSIRPPRSPRLKRFTLFMSRSLQPDGRESWYLHMGYFKTLTDAERWVEAVRPRYPDAFATIATVESLRPANSEAPSLPPTAFHPVVPQSSDPALLKDDSLTDTQVMEILEARVVYAVQLAADEKNCAQIALLRPDDTGVRRALREAVAQDAPVSFAVQLHWSAQPIDLNRVASLAIFKPYTLYATESRREARSRYFLRLGFFADPLAAKQVAVQARSAFPSAAVVPVVDQEVTRAREGAMHSSAIPYLGEQRVDREIDSDGTSGSSTRLKALSDPHHHVSAGAEAAGRTLEPPAGSRTWTEPDSLSESGVRHLRVELRERSSGRWKIVRFEATAEQDAI